MENVMSIIDYSNIITVAAIICAVVVLTGAYRSLKKEEPK
jgi:hypothetical protein